MKREQAETIALQALAFIAGEDRALEGLISQTGLGFEDMKAQVGDATFLAGVMDFTLSDESLLLAFCEAAELPPETPTQARRALPGGEQLEY
ncbi:MAG: DUF3572 domain-containing protein [Rhodospirillales bacterium]|nr:DUF3572 domain-containing protein [Rhodospirillales bacterium]